MQCYAVKIGEGWTKEYFDVPAEHPLGQTSYFIVPGVMWRHIHGDPNLLIAWARQRGFSVEIHRCDRLDHVTYAQMEAEVMK